MRVVSNVRNIRCAGLLHKIHQKCAKLSAVIRSKLFLHKHENNTHEAERALPAWRGAGGSSRGTRPALHLLFLTLETTRTRTRLEHKAQDSTSPALLRLQQQEKKVHDAAEF